MESFRRLLRGANCFIRASGCNDIDPCFDQLRRKFGNQIKVWPICAILDHEVLAFNKAAASQFIEKGNVYRLFARKG